MANGSLTVAELAAREGSAPQTTLRLVRAAVSLGLLTEEAGGRFASTPLLHTLRNDDPQSLRPLVLSLLGDWLPWHQFVSGIRSGNTPSLKAFGGSMFDYLAAHPEEAELFTAAMAGGTSLKWAPGRFCGSTIQVDWAAAASIASPLQRSANRTRCGMT